MNYRLIYVNKQSYNWQGYATYEFIFCDDSCDINDVYGDGWEAPQAEGVAQPPDEDYVSKVGIVKLRDYEMEVVQDSIYFGVCDAKDGVIALAWEKIDDNFIQGEKRLVFNYGQSLNDVEELLDCRNLELKYEN